MNYFFVLLRFQKVTFLPALTWLRKWIFGIIICIGGLGSPLALAATSNDIITTAAVGGPSSSSVQSTSSSQPQVQPTSQQPSPVTQPPARRQAVPPVAIEEGSVFGSNLFVGAFSQGVGSSFNPNYAIAIGDMVRIDFWGGFELHSTFTVDPKGNVFLPHIGPVHIAGVRNQDLQGLIQLASKNVFRTTVHIYASLATSQSVRVFVSGFVKQPGLFEGTSMDSLLYYLDKAGGIDFDRGSFLKIEVKRNNQVRSTINLYDFLLHGELPMVQFADGDMIFVHSRQHTIVVSGLAENPNRFEFKKKQLKVSDLIELAKPLANVTHIRVTRNTGMVKYIEYFRISKASDVLLNSGDEVEFTSDQKSGTITVRVEGEHESAQEYVLQGGTRLGDLLKMIEFSDRSNKNSIQLFRRSVKENQKKMLDASLRSLEAAALEARSGTVEEAQLRVSEASLLLQWVDRAKAIEPLGQVYIAGSNRDELFLENGDVLNVPSKDLLVMISGEVLFPNAIIYNKRYRIRDYIKQTGGLLQSADSSRIVVAHVDGSYDVVSARERGRKVHPGDSILVVPIVDFKTGQFVKDVSAILFQLAFVAKTALLF